MKKTIWTAALAAAALVAGPAMAQVDATEVDGQKMTQPVEDLGRYNVAAQAGIGSFVGGGIGTDTGVGPLWGVKLEGPLARSFGWEVGYEGSRTPVSGVVDGSALWRHGLNGMAKVYAPMGQSAEIRPFAGAGIGASHVTAGVGTGEGYQNDLMGEIPLGAGIEYNAATNGLTAGIRGTYRVLLDQNIASNADSGGGMLGGSLVVGGQF
jgi:opacity protein-like surface antigen